jgi:hypothetical protein
VKSNDTWEDSERHRLGPYGHMPKNEPKESNGGLGYLLAGLLVATAVLVVSTILVLLVEGWHP